uniref:Uncharacterized protein n=1 Tax=Oryza rufipogon TaxID=4529 RepID=A0A0E0Q7X0_ORYRU
MDSPIFYVIMLDATNQDYLACTHSKLSRITWLEDKNQSERSIQHALHDNRMEAIHKATGLKIGEKVVFRLKNVKLSVELKNYVKDIAEFLHHSSKFYIVAMNNTFMKQDRVDGHILQQPITDNYRRYVSSTSTKQIDCRQQYIFCEVATGNNIVIF